GRELKRPASRFCQFTSGERIMGLRNCDPCHEGFGLGERKSELAGAAGDLRCAPGFPGARGTALGTSGNGRYGNKKAPAWRIEVEPNLHAVLARAAVGPARDRHSQASLRVAPANTAMDRSRSNLWETGTLRIRDGWSRLERYLPGTGALAH